MRACEPETQNSMCGFRQDHKLGNPAQRLRGRPEFANKAGTTLYCWDLIPAIRQVRIFWANIDQKSKAATVQERDKELDKPFRYPKWVLYPLKVKFEPASTWSW